MMRLIEFRRDPLRLYIGWKHKRHLHHGLQGIVLMVIAIVLIVTDLKDFPWRFIEDFEQYVSKDQPSPG